MLRITLSSLVVSAIIVMALTLIGVVVGSWIGEPIGFNSYGLAAFAVTIFFIVWLAKAINYVESNTDDLNQEE